MENARANIFSDTYTGSNFKQKSSSKMKEIQFKYFTLCKKVVVCKIERTGNNRGVYGVLYILCTIIDLIEAKS